MKILFIHQNFPGQFKHLAPALAQHHQVLALMINKAANVKNVQVLQYPLTKRVMPHGHPWMVDMETKIIRGESCAKAMSQLKQQGFVPDLVIAHPSWGEALFVKDIFPATKLLNFFEFFYHAHGADVDFDPEFALPSWESDARIRAKNANNYFSLDQMDHGYTPTYWQRQLHPAIYHDKISVIHDGIDTERVIPCAEACLSLNTAQGQRVFGTDDEVITFVNRNLEPYRGYHIFMRALPEIQRQRPNAITLIVGGHEVSYGSGPSNGGCWRDIFLNEVKDQLDMSRIYFLGNIPYDIYLTLLQISSVHIYLTYPFVLSWSLIEAMSAECLVIGSKTAPVEEVISHGENGLLVDFFDIPALSAAVVDTLAHPQTYAHLRSAARRTAVTRYDVKTVCLPQQLALVEKILSA